MECPGSPEPHGGKKKCQKETPKQEVFEDEARKRRRSSGAAKKLFGAPESSDGADVIKVSNLPKPFLEVMPSYFQS